MKKLSILLAACLAWSFSFAQTPSFYTIQQIQSVPGFKLAQCNDSSSLTGQKIITSGVVVTPVSITVNATSSSINAIGSAACAGAFYIQNGTGPFSGILVRQSLTTKNVPTGIANLNVGDEITIQGTVREYSNTISGGHNFPGETHIDLDTTVQIQVDNVNVTVQGPTSVNISEMSDAFLNNNLTTGEKFEGVYVKITGANVSDRPNSTSGTSSMPAACTPATGSRRRRFTVSDANGNKIVISDRFLAGRFSSPATSNNSPGASGNSEIGIPGGTLLYPDAGASYTSLEGIVTHWLNAGSGSPCSNRQIVTPDYTLGTPGAPAFQTTASNQGYTINPFSSTHYKVGRPLPVITGLKTFVGPFGNGLQGAVPPANTEFNVQATITQGPAPSGNSVSFSSASIFYTTDPLSSSNPTWTEVTMQSTFQGNDYYGTIPGQPEGTFVRYYIKATNTDPAPSNVSYFPSPTAPKYYTVRNGGLTIYDLQYTPYADGNSSFAGANGALGQTVTVTGIVTSSTKDLGVVYIQQENINEWAGITVYPQGAISNNIVQSVNNALVALQRGQRVTIVGQVSETFGQTVLNATRVIAQSGLGSIKPITLPVGTFTNNDQEKYEGMLVTLVNNNQKIKVIEPKSSNRGCFRVGTNVSNSSVGTLIMTGVQDARYQVWTYGSLLTNYMRSKNREFNGNDGIISQEVASFDTVTTATTIDSLRGIVLYNFNNQIVTPRDNQDFFGVSNVGSVWNPAANPANFFATKDNATTHTLQWNLPKRPYGATGFVIDYAAPSSSIPPSTAGPYYPLKEVGRYDTVVVNSNLPANIGLLYRVRAYRTNADNQRVYSVAMQSNIAGTFVVITNTEDAADVSNSKMVIYPNPSQDNELNYILHEAAGEQLTFSLMDVTGKVVMVKQVAQPTAEGRVSLENLPAGHYTLVVQSAGRRLHRTGYIKLN